MERSPLASERGLVDRREVHVEAETPARARDDADDLDRGVALARDRRFVRSRREAEVREASLVVDADVGREALGLALEVYDAAAHRPAVAGDRHPPPHGRESRGAARGRARRGRDQRQDDGDHSHTARV